ncbi:hypothetical protein FGG08_002590 [Glutinoglossum americanum]|uniref:Uncharacterized protein n=1 Tax=Glutinoglossum americanum TaxID=1670608 RepID=A0A9P8I9D6_9PEZI|nr:hypothetical protein FGG08_002590 [Glutinoglossum americanum]
MADQAEPWNPPSAEFLSTQRPLVAASASISTQPSMSASPSPFAARARRAEHEAAGALEAVNTDKPNYNLNSPGHVGNSPFAKFKPATKTKGAKAWLPFDLFADAESTQDNNSVASTTVREYSGLSGHGDVASGGANQRIESIIGERALGSVQKRVKSPEPAKLSSESLKWSVDAQFDVEEWDPDLPPGPEDPTILETLPLAPKLINFSGLGPAGKSFISSQPPTSGSDPRRDTRVIQAPKPLGLPFSYPENAKMHHFGSGTLFGGQHSSNLEGEQTVGREETIQWPIPSRKVFTMRVPVPKKQTQEETLAALGVQPSVQSEGSRYQTQEETLAALGVQPPVQSDQAKATTPSRPTHDQILSNLFTVEDLLKQDKIEEEMQARGMSIGVRGIETVQRLAGFPNPLQQLAKSRLAGYAVAKAEKAAKAGLSGERSVQSQVKSHQHDPFFSGHGSLRGENNFASTGTAYHFDSNGPSNKNVAPSNFSFPLNQQVNQGDQLYHRERASYNVGFGIASGSDASPDVRCVEPIRQYSSPPKANQYSQNTQPIIAASSREVLLKGLQRAITEAEESSLAVFDSSSLKSLALPIPDLTSVSLKAPTTSRPLSLSGTRWRSNIERIGPSDPLPWKERPVHIHTVVSTPAMINDSIEVPKPTTLGIGGDPGSITWVDKKVIGTSAHFSVNRRTGPMLEVASQWWNEDKRPDADLRKHLQAIADQDLSENSGLKNEQWPALGAESPQNVIPEGYCANHLLILLLSSLHEYLVDSPNEQRAMFGSFVEVPEWCVEKGTSGLTSFFGEDWGVPPQRVGRDPRYRPLMHDPRFMVSYDEQEYWNRSGEQWTHARRYC